MAILPGQKTFLQIQQEISEEVLDTAIATTTSRPNLARLKVMINDAQREICNAFPFSFMFRESSFPTVVNQQTPYDVDTTAQEIIFMGIQAKQQSLVWMDYNSWVKVYPGGFTNFQPTIPGWYIPAPPDTANTAPSLRYYIFPQADQVYTISYGFELSCANMTADADYPVIPARYQHVLIYLAKAKAWDFLGQGSKLNFQTAFEMYQKEYAKMIILDQKVEECSWRFRFRKEEMARSGINNIDRVLWFGTNGW
jgi:hypothetical protein